MSTRLEVSFRGVRKTTHLEELVREKVEKLEKICPKLNSCRVAIEQDQSHNRKGNPFRVRVDLRIPPSQELVVNHTSSNSEDESLDHLIRSTFISASRQLKEKLDRRRGKDTRTRAHARVAQQPPPPTESGTVEL